MQAVHFVAKNQGGEKICEVLLNLINCLLDLDIIERKGDTEKKTEEKQKEAEQDGSGSKKESMTSFSLAMDSIVR